MFKIDSHVKAPRVKKPKSQRVPQAVYDAQKRYGEAYKRVYGVAPIGYRYDVNTKLIHVGNSHGVSLKRLNELITMLKARVE